LRSHSVQSLEEPEKAKVLAEALMQAQTSSPRTVVTAFAPVAGALPDDVFVAILDALQEAIAAAASLRPRERDEVLQELASSFRGQAWWEALALAKLPFHSGVPDRVGRINEETAKLRGARRPLDRAEAAASLLEFEPYLPTPLLAEALQALCSSVDARGADRRVGLLRRLAEPLASLAPDVLAPIWSQALRNLRTTANERRQLLAEIEALIPVLAALGGPAGLGEATRAIRDVGAWFP
jgi:hypothetical protein